MYLVPGTVYVSGVPDGALGGEPTKVKLVAPSAHSCS